MSAATQKSSAQNRFDIREYKRSLREKYKSFRSSIPPEKKRDLDRRIFKNILDSKLYKQTDLILIYVSMKDEIFTHDFIEKAIEDGKTVAVPYCISGTRDMDFYKINSLDELEVRTYGVMEPIAEKAEKITDFRNSICILPGLSFDKRGYRLGYGGGYYDRFLNKKFNGKAIIGVCYQKAFRERLKHGYFDVSANYIVTEQALRPAQRKKYSEKKKRAN